MALGRSADLSVDISGDATGLERALKSAETATGRAQNAVTRYDASLRSLESDLMKLEKSLDDDVTAAMQRQHDAMEKTGRGMVVFGAAVAGALALAGREAMKWESAWTGVTKTVDGNAQQMGILEDQLRGLAKTLPASHQEIAAVAEAAGQLGVKRQDIAGFTKTMIDLAETTNLTADEAATSIAQFMNVMQSAPEDVDNLGAALVALGNAGASTEAGILAMAQRLSGAGALIGASESDVLALASAMADLGIEAQLGGGAMSRTLTKMYAAVKDGGPILENFASIAGTTAQEFATQFENDPVRAVDTFVQGLARIKDSGGNVVQALKDLKITGTQDLQVLLRLTGAGDRLTGALDLSATAWAENIALIEEANKRYGTSEAKMQIAQNALRDIAIDIGGVVLPAFTAMMEAVADLASFFGDLPGPAKVAIAVVAALAAAVALAGGAALVAIPKMAAFKATVEGLSAGALKTAGTRLMGIGSILGGPWGIAMGAGIAALTVFAAKQGDLAREIDDVRSTLDEQTGAVTDNTRAWAVKSLNESGVLDKARELGVSLDLVTDAALGNADAIQALQNLEASYSTGHELSEAFSDETLAARESTEANNEKARGLQVLLGLIGTQQGVVDDARAAWDLEREAMGGAADETDRVSEGTEVLADAMGGAAGETSDLTGEVKTLGEELGELSGAYLDNRSASRAIRDSLRDIRAKVKEVVKEHGAVRDSQGKVNKAFQAGTATGDELQGMLDDLAGKYQDQLDALEKTGAAEGRVQAKYKQSRADLYEVARSLGYTKGEAREYVRQVLATPKAVRTRFAAETGDALADIKSVQDRLNAIDGTVARTYVQTHITTTRGRKMGEGLYEANGGLLDFYARGGISEDHVAQIAPAGAWRVWAEPETGGEGYIPLAPSKRPRSIDIWREVGARLGVQFMEFAEGGFLGGSAGPISSGFITGQMSIVDAVPNLRAYNRAVRDEAAALREVRRERRQNAAATKDVREAEKALAAARKKDGAGSKKAEAAAERELTKAKKAAERAENQLERAQDKHAKTTDRVKAATEAYAQAQAAAVAQGEQVASRAQEGASIFGGGFPDPAWVSRRIQDTIKRIERFTSLRRDLVKAGIHPMLLAQLDEEGPTRGAIMFAERLLASPDVFASLNAQSARLGTVSAQLGADTAAIHGPLAGRDVRYGSGVGQVIVRPAGATGTTLNVYDTSGSPERTGREAARQIAFAGVG